MLYKKKQTPHFVHQDALVLLTKPTKDLILLNGWKLILQTTKTQQI